MREMTMRIGPFRRLILLIEEGIEYRTCLDSLYVFNEDLQEDLDITELTDDEFLDWLGY